MTGVLCVFMCLRAYVLGVLSCLASLCAWQDWRVYVLSVHACLCACLLVMMKCFIFLRVCVLGVFFCLICFKFQCLNLKIHTAKNLCALLSWKYFLFLFWYQLIKLFKTNFNKIFFNKILFLWSVLWSEKSEVRIFVKNSTVQDL